jgi:hypothetical protein
MFGCVCRNRAVKAVDQASVRSGLRRGRGASSKRHCHSHSWWKANAFVPVLLAGIVIATDTKIFSPMPILVSPFSPLGRQRSATTADWFTAATLASLPWSTSAAAILVTCLLVAILFTLDRRVTADVLSKPAAYLPLLLWCILCAGMLWADAPWRARLAGLEHFHKLLLIPVLMIHFSRSQRWRWVWSAFIASSIVLLLYSWASVFWPALTFGDRMPGVPVKDYIYQGIAFSLSACLLICAGIVFVRQKQFLRAAACAIVVTGFFANIVYVAASRTTLAALPILLLIVGYRTLRLKGVALAAVAFACLSFLAWTTSPYLQARVTQLVHGTVDFNPQAMSSEAQRIEFWRKSVAAMRERPLAGYGTGSIEEVFVRSLDGEKGAAGMVVRNPHNQTLAVGLQCGAIGILILYLMWLNHVLLFARKGWPAMVGLLIVAQNIVGSMFNSHLSDFTAGWLYVLGVGVLGGTVLGRRARSAAVAPEPALQRADVALKPRS